MENGLKSSRFKGSIACCVQGSRVQGSITCGVQLPSAFKVQGFKGSIAFGV